MTNEPDNIDLKDWSHRHKEFHDTMSITRTRMFIKDEMDKKKKKRKRILILRLLLICSICALVFLDIRIASHKNSYHYQDVLKALKGDDLAYQNVSNYVRYLVGRVFQHGRSGLNGKWLEGIPKSFDNAAWIKLKKLGQKNFVIDSIEADKESVFHVKCRPLESLSDTIELDVIKVKVEEDFIFRLLRVY
ncbi:MAG: hypothetical protein A2020_10635 [Lentisphaerae bacterium GWF2_45_14]|nr:MAG: hypothetical protein A2020_10635 [Lentisphaerae bacterium GWF2_45_14]